MNRSSIKQQSRELGDPSERRPLATPEQLSEHTGIPIPTLYQWRHHGQGPKSMRIGKHIRYRWEDIDSWIAERAAETQSGGRAS